MADGEEDLRLAQQVLRYVMDQPPLPGMPPPPEPPDPPMAEFLIKFKVECSQDGAINVLDHILRFPNDWRRTAEKYPGDFDEAVSQYIWDTVDDACEWWPSGHHTLIFDPTPFDLQIDYRLGVEMLEALSVELRARGLWPLVRSDDGSATSPEVISAPTPEP